jgi:flagellin
MYISTNMNSLFAQDALTLNSRLQAKTMQQLSTGQRINSAADDAASLTIGNRMTAQINGLNQATQNANDGISLLQTAEGALVQQTQMLQRMRTLALEASTDSTVSDDKTALDTEYQQLLEQLDQIGANTQWNGSNILDASGGQATTGTYVFQVGATSSVTISVDISDMSTSGALSDISGSVITSASDAQSAIDNIDLAIAAVDTQRAALGAGINRLTYTADNLTNIAEQATQSRSRILDTDFSQASAMLARTMIIQQAATAMLAQANQQPQTVLALLK